MEDEESLSSRLGDVMGEQSHDAKHSQAAVLELLGLELGLHLRSLVDGATIQQEGSSKVEVTRDSRCSLVFPTDQLPVA